MAEISGTVEIRSDKRRGKMTIVIQPDSKDLEPRDHHVPQDKHLLVHTGDRVEAGDPLCDGPLVPHDILRIKGEEALYNYMLAEIQSVYRAQTQRINDKHIEIILTQMTRKVRVETPGDSEFLPGEVLDKFAFHRGNEDLGRKIRIMEPGETGLIFLGMLHSISKRMAPDIGLTVLGSAAPPGPGRLAGIETPGGGL